MMNVIMVMLDSLDCNIKDPIGSLTFYTNFTFKLFHVSVAVASNIESLKYYLYFLNKHIFTISW